jgi:thiopeptide-type bacteriocin biosynthesis protein
MPADAIVRAALAIGSPDLFEALGRVRAGDRRAPRLHSKLRRYLVRMATRPTPYGLFAGVGLVSWDSATDLRLGAAQPRTRTRPDMQWLLALVAKLEGEIAVRRCLGFAANPTALVRAGRLYLAAPDGPTGAGESVSLRATQAVRRTLELTRTPVAYERLAGALLSVPGATGEKVDAMIEELRRHGVLVSDLRPPLTCSNPARYVHDRLATVSAAVSPAAAAAAGLERLLVALEEWDALALAQRIGRWPGLVDTASSVHSGNPASSPLQLDLALPLEGRRMHRAVALEAAGACELLLRLSPAPDGPPHLDEYRRRFVERYGAASAVPLLELLSPEFGLGPPPPEGFPNSAARDRRRQALEELALAAIRDRRLIVELDDETLSRLETWSPAAATAPVSLDLSVLVAASSAASVDDGDFHLIVAPSVGADGAGRVAGRFADLLGDDAIRALSRAARMDAARVPGSLHVEIVYAPRDARSANIAVRPATRSHEIVLGAMPGGPWERVVPLDELVVSVAEGRFHVRWPGADADLIVVQGHMLSPLLAPDLARFLLDVAADGRVQLGPFDWGPAASYPFLPRVQRGRIVLAPARWRVARGDMPPLPASASSERLAAWRARWSVPRHAYLVDLDNRLLLDLEDPHDAELLANELRGLPEDGFLLLQEPLPGPADAWLPGPAGEHMLELVVPLVLRPDLPAEAPAAVVATRAPAAIRLRPPGSDWLYLKLYCPPALQDELIAGPLRTLAQFTISAALADAWFFMRYADPDPHLRIRFHGDPKTLLGPLLDQLATWAAELVADGACPRFSFDTYEREVSRYGGEHGIVLAEAIFAADSEAVAELLKLERAHREPLDRLSTLILGVDDLLAALGLTDIERLRFYRARAILSKEDGRVYRERSAELRRLLGRPAALADSPRGAAIRRILDARGDRLRPIAAELDALERTGGRRPSKCERCGSYVHLHCNRLLIGGSPLEARALQLLARTREGLSRAPLS